MYYTLYDIMIQSQMRLQKTYDLVVVIFSEG